MSEHDDVMNDRDGSPGDSKFAFEFERKVLNKKVIGFFYAGEYEFEDDRIGNVVRLVMEDGGVFTIAVEQPAKLEMYISIKDTPEDVTKGLVM